MAKKVAIFGGGMAGLAAAHELVRRGYVVEVYEAAGDYGGKSASQPLPAAPQPKDAQHAPLLGEHGFRFFPGFYRHVIATMKEIPNVDGAPRAVCDDLVPTLNAAVAYPGKALIVFPRRIDLQGFGLFEKLVELPAAFGFPVEDLARMAWFRLKYLTSGPLRREQAYDDISWWQFIEGDSPLYTDGFREFEQSIPRTMSAMVAKTSSARVIGDITMQMIFGYVRPEEEPDRVLVGPTSERWIDHWAYELTSSGVTFYPHCEITGLTCVETQPSPPLPRTWKITGASVWDESTQSSSSVSADYYVLALPVEKAHPLLRASIANAPEPLRPFLEVTDLAPWKGWMSGAQFYLRSDPEMVDGHVFYPRSEWALTSVSQGQFWKLATNPPTPIDQRYGDGSVKGILSVDISDWDTKSTPGPGKSGAAARDCSSEDEILDDVLAQLRESLGAPAYLDDSEIAYRHLDSNLRFAGTPAKLENTSNLLVHPTGALKHRPKAATGVDNLFLASDYVRTKTLLATMEGANEAARTAVNALLDADGSDHVRCALYDLQEEPIFDPLKAIDDLRFQNGRVHLMDEWPLRLLADTPSLLAFVEELLNASVDLLAAL